MIIVTAPVPIGPFDLGRVWGWGLRLDNSFVFARQNDPCRVLM